MFDEPKEDYFMGDDKGFDEKVIYIPKDGVAVEIDAVVNEDFPYQDEYFRGVEFAIAELDVHNSDVSSPRIGDVYKFHDDDWNHINARKTGNIWTISVKRGPS